MRCNLISDAQWAFVGRLYSMGYRQSELATWMDLESSTVQKHLQALGVPHVSPKVQHEAQLPRLETWNKAIYALWNKEEKDGEKSAGEETKVGEGLQPEGL